MLRVPPPSHGGRALPDDLSINLPRDATAPTVARDAVQRHFAGVLDRDRISELELIVSELVSNAVVHGCGAITLNLQRDGATAR